MISKNKIKLIRSLETKKGREKAGLFVAEGPKVVNDLLDAGFTAEDIIEDAEDIKRVSFLQHPQPMLGVFRFKSKSASPDILSTLSIALDGVQDPGNLGTIIRVADWFGIDNIICSNDTVDCWNPKVVQATMGSIARVNIHYINLEDLIAFLPGDFPVYGTMLDGRNIYEEALSKSGIIVMGNEGNGISQPIREKVNRKLLIPTFSNSEHKADSLNVAIATSIVCSEFKRRG